MEAEVATASICLVTKGTALQFPDASFQWTVSATVKNTLFYSSSPHLSLSLSLSHTHTHTHTHTRACAHTRNPKDFASSDTEWSCIQPSSSCNNNNNNKTKANICSVQSLSHVLLLATP